MTRVLSTIAAGWLLVTYHGGTIAWYESKADCEVAEQDTLPLRTSTACVRDRFSVRPSPETKP